MRHVVVNMFVSCCATLLLLQWLYFCRLSCENYSVGQLLFKILANL